MANDPDDTIHQVLAGFLDVSPRSVLGKRATRGTLVLDSTTEFLQPSLRDSNFQVVVRSDRPPWDFETKHLYLTNRILVTQKTGDFLYDAPVLDYGVIGLDAIPSLETAPEYTNNDTAKLVSRAVGEFMLISKGGAFVLMLHRRRRTRLSETRVAGLPWTSVSTTQSRPIEHPMNPKRGEGIVKRMTRIDSFLMSNIFGKHTGVEGTVIWVSAGEFAAPPPDHGPRLLVVLGEKSSIKGLKTAVSVRFTTPPEVLGTLPVKVARKVVEFVDKNRSVLLR